MQSRQVGRHTKHDWLKVYIVKFGQSTFGQLKSTKYITSRSLLQKKEYHFANRLYAVQQNLL